MPGEVECDDVLNYWNYCSFIRQFRRQLLSDTPCIVAPTTVLADSLPTAIFAPIALTSVLAECRPTALLAFESADDRARILVTHRTPCTECADDRARRLMPHRTPCIYSADDRARRLMPHRTPCTDGADDRAHRLHPHRTPCSQSADDRAHRMQTHRTPYMKSANDRARRLLTHRTPCTDRADGRADKRYTPCTSSGTSPRARMAPLWEGLSSASCPSSSTLLSASRQHRHRRYPELRILTFGRHTVVILPSRAPQSAVDQKTGSCFGESPLFLAGSSKRGSSFARAAGCVLARGVRGECVRAGLTCRSPAMMSRAAAIALAALCILAPGAPPSKPTAPLSPQF